MLLLFISLFKFEILESCSLSKKEGFVLTKYYKPDCPHCSKIEGYIDEIDSVLERNNINLKMHYVDCSTCNCEENNIVSVPTVVLTEDEVEKKKIVGKVSYNAYISMIISEMNLPTNIFYKHVKNVPGKLVKLKEYDFDDAFEGPWIILYNADKDKNTRKILEKMAVDYKDEISFGEIDAKRTQKIRNKFNIRDDPILLAVFRGLFATLYEDKTYENIKKFAEKLIEPAFKPIDAEKFKEEVRVLQRGEPIFIVFYSDLALANHYFKRIAHEYKFRTKFFKTNDANLFERAGVYPKKPGLENINDNDKVILSVYKDGAFHQCPFGVEENQKVPEWIFNSHFPNLTKITNDNFSSVFHGLKSVLLLITRNDQYVDQLEKYATSKKSGLPFFEYLFATIDSDAFPTFTSTLLPTLPVPVLVVYNPQTQRFSYKLTKFDKIDFNSYANKMLEEYEKGKLYEYPYEKTYTFHFVIFALVVISVFMISKSMTKKFIKRD